MTSKFHSSFILAKIPVSTGPLHMLFPLPAMHFSSSFTWLSSSFPQNKLSLVIHSHESEYPSFLALIRVTSWHLFTGLVSHSLPVISCIWNIICVQLRIINCLIDWLNNICLLAGLEKAMCLYLPLYPQTQLNSWCTNKNLLSRCVNSSSVLLSLWQTIITFSVTL